MRRIVESASAVAEVMRYTFGAAIHSSPRKLPAPNKATVASLPALETTLILTRPFWT
jgi:hypothetical protein